MNRSLGLVIFLGLALAPAVAAAQDKPVYVTGGAGYLDLSDPKDEAGPALQIQVLPGTRSIAGDAPARAFNDPAPVTGSAAFQGSGALGVGVELPIGDAFTFTPSFAAGQADPRLAPVTGGATEYRSGAELSYQFSNDMKLGAGVYLHSDGGRALPEREDSGMVTFSFTVPIGR